VSPLKPLTFRRWQVTGAFVVNVVAIVVVTILLTNLIRENHDRVRDVRRTELEIRTERIERSALLNLFLGYQCRRDAFRDAVIVAQLQAARQRVLASLPNGPTRRHQLASLARGIAALGADVTATGKPNPRSCLKQIPPVVVPGPVGGR